MRHVLVILLCLLGLPFRTWAQDLTFPLKQDSVRFAVIGDSGAGSQKQYELAALMAQFRKKFPFDFVIMLGDNIYGSNKPSDFEKKFERPYKAMLDDGVSFYATLGNHDNPNQRFYKLFNMKEQRYYSFSKGNVRFFVLDSNYMDPKQLDWTEKELQASTAAWKVCYFHHPLYSSGERHGSDTDLRLLLEPLLVKYGVNIVLAGHEHFYERIKPQNGVSYFISGAASKLRRHNIARTDLTAAGFDQDLSFMLVEVAGKEFYFQTIARTGETVDSGVIPRANTKPSEVTSSRRDDQMQTSAIPTQLVSLRPLYVYWLNAGRLLRKAGDYLLVVVGWLTKYVAFIASGEMAFAYFMVHARKGLWPLLNGGELAVIYCFLFLFIAARGYLVYSLDTLLEQSRFAREGQKMGDRISI